MTTLLLLNTLVLFLEMVKTHDYLTRTKSKGRNALTSQPFSQFSPITEQIDHDKL